MPRKVESERDVLRRFEAHRATEPSSSAVVDAMVDGGSSRAAAHSNATSLDASSVGLIATDVMLDVEAKLTPPPVDAQPPLSAVAPPPPAPAIPFSAASPQPSQPTTTHASVTAMDGQPRQGRRKVRIAVQGCCHGELGKIYAQCEAHERETGEQIDFLICCGDFQSVRNDNDLRSMAVPDKYKTYGDFVEYYSGRKQVPVLTLFIGGNHEASNLLAEEYYGGYVAKGIYYLGHSSVVTVCGVRIGALSGIFKGRDYVRPYPTVPYNSQTLREAYHVRKFEMEKLHTFANAVMTAQPSSDGAKLQPPRHGLDIMISHDWPVGITKYGNEAALLKIKPFFADDIKHGALGNPHTMELLQTLRPRYWMAAHLHCYFTAAVPHMKFAPGSRVPSMAANPTEFIALDKCIHHSRKCLTFMAIEVDSDAGEDGVGSGNVAPSTNDGNNNNNNSTAPRRPFPSVCMDPIWAAIAVNTHAALRTTHGGAGNDHRSWEHTAEPSSNEQLAPVALQAAAKQLAASAGQLVMHSTDSFIRTVLHAPRGNPLVAAAAMGSQQQQHRMHVSAQPVMPPYHQRVPAPPGSLHGPVVGVGEPQRTTMQQPAAAVPPLSSTAVAAQAATASDDLGALE